MTQTVKEAMIKLGYSKEYTDKYHTLTTGGEAAIQVNGVTGNKFKPTKGTGQVTQQVHQDLSLDMNHSTGRFKK